MIRHIVLFRWSAEATEEAIAQVGLGLAGLPEQIDSVRGYRFGPDAGISAGNWDFAVVADFDDRDGFLTYRDHPAHQGLIAERIAPILADRAAVQTELD